MKTKAITKWDPPQLKSLLARCARRRILVIGDVGIDRYTIGSVERISPEAPVPIVFVEDEQLKLGLAANVADNIQTLQGRADLVGVVGKDRPAQDFRKLLKKCRISAAHLVQDPSRRTVLKDRVVSDRQQLLRVDYESLHGLDASAERALFAKIKRLIPQSDAIILQDYAKGMVSAHFAHEVFALAKREGKLVAVDPNTKTPLEFYRGAFVLTPNVKEAERLSGISIRDEGSLAQAGLKILKATRAEHVVITRGKDGMAIFTAGAKDIRLIPTYAREVYDVSGAGDTVISVIALVLAAKGSIEEACILGNLAAGVEVGKRGTATVTQDEILLALEFFSQIGI
ncbi:MAG: hypothetical protein A2X94_07800 [Bdellovibrionales bacterium GWB1_55_8]|nr:MAG: hypothetical protein A2X94_07800 [Bdellovibrionales bacterium GWB1_55_8]